MAGCAEGTVTAGPLDADVAAGIGRAILRSNTPNEYTILSSPMIAVIAVAIPVRIPCVELKKDFLLLVSFMV